MPRPLKKGFDYFPLDVDFFSDRKVKILRARFGADGLTVYLYLLCEIYKNGFYTKLDKDFEFIIADDLNMSEEKIRQIIAFLSERSLLDGTLLGSDTVLTSVGIQKRWQEMVKGRASKTPPEIERRYWLLTEAETEEHLCAVLGFSKKNEGFSENNPDNSENYDTKESKGKQNKKNKMKERENMPAHTRGELKPYGKFENVMLSETEHAALQELIPGATDYIERFSAKIAAKGYKYGNHYAAICSWYIDDKKDEPDSSFNVDDFWQVALERGRRWVEEGKGGQS